jgi:hypothetical protein
MNSALKIDFFLGAMDSIFAWFQGLGSPQNLEVFDVTGAKDEHQKLSRFCLLWSKVVDVRPTVG